MVLRQMQVSWAFRWCESPCCACLGCANRSGRLSATREQWANALTKMVYLAINGSGIGWTQTDKNRLEDALRPYYKTNLEKT